MARNKSITLVPKKITKPSGLKNDGTPNVAWRKFKERLEEFDKTPPENWAPEHILGYLLDRYQSVYEMSFSLSYSGPPSKCSEMYCVKRMLTTIGTEKGNLAKEYVDWVFEKKIIPNKIAIKSLAFFFTSGLCNEFKSVFKKRNKITRSTQLPQYLLDITNKLQLNTYGDLAFAKLALDSDPEREDLNNLFRELENAGFNEMVLQALE